MKTLGFVAVLFLAGCSDRDFTREGLLGVEVDPTIDLTPTKVACEPPYTSGQGGSLYIVCGNWLYRVAR